jgi:serine phosphatase RsbU (regulator of sigma subunit)
LLYLTIIICILAIAMSTYAAALNFGRLRHFASNRLSGVIGLMTVLMVASILYQMLFPRSPHLMTVAQLYIALTIFVNQLYFHFTQIYPRWEKKAPLWLILPTALPGLTMVAATLATRLILADAKYADGSIVYTYGPYFYLYVATFGFYLATIIITMFYKSRKLQNEWFRRQMLYRSIWDFFGASLVIVSFIIMPYFFNMQQLVFFGIPFSAFILMYINAFSVKDDRLIDYRRFYLSAAYWSVIFTVLTVPVYLLLRYRSILTIGGLPVPVPVIAIAVFAYLMLFFRYPAAWMSAAINRRFSKLEQSVNALFHALSSQSESREHMEISDHFFNTAVDALEKTFGIGNASFFIFREKDHGFLYSYGFGSGIELRSIADNHALIACLRDNPGLVDGSMLYTNERLKAHAPALISFYKENNISVALPVFTHEKQLVGVLLIGPLKNNRHYSTDHISALEIYRIHFEVSLANSLYLDQIKTTQIDDHDRMVVRTIKNKVIPKSLAQIEGIRLSSFHLNNSEYGGDYFDSYALRPDTIGVIMADTSDAGVDSAILALQFYGVLHAPSAGYDQPDRFLNTVNWVIASSRFNEVYAPAYYMTYSTTTKTLQYANAAMKPLTVFDAGRDNFLELDTNGIPIGIDKSFSFESRSMQLSPGSIGFLYSDGIETAVNTAGTPYSTGRIKDIIRLSRADTPAVIVRKILADFQAYTKEAGKSNDASLVLFKIT